MRQQSGRSGMRWLGVVLAAIVAGGATAQQVVPTPGGRAGAVPPPNRYVPSADRLSAVAISERCLRYLERLGSPSYAEREAATAELLSSADVDKDELYAALARLDLTAEQRHRVLLVVQDLVLNKPRGAVGIRVDRRFWPDQIVIQELLPELPARRVLEVGDRITHVEGEPLISWDSFVRAVQSRLPGSKVSITIERPMSPGRQRRLDVGGDEPRFERMQVELELGSAERLRDPATGAPSAAGPIVTERRSEADEAVREWAPRPRAVEVSGQ